MVALYLIAGATPLSYSFTLFEVRIVQISNPIFHYLVLTCVPLTDRDGLSRIDLREVLLSLLM